MFRIQAHTLACKITGKFNSDYLFLVTFRSLLLLAVEKANTFITLSRFLVNQTRFKAIIATKTIASEAAHILIAYTVR